MVILNSTANKFTAAIQADYPNLIVTAFTDSKTMLTLQREDQHKLSVFAIYFGWVGGTTETIRYYTDPSGKLELPLQNILREIASHSPVVMNITLYEVIGLSAVDTLSLSIAIYAGVSYNDVLAPRGKDAPSLYWSNEHYVVLPPNVIINPDTFSGVIGQGYVIVESNYHDIDGDTVWSALTGGVSSAITPSGDRGCELVIPYAADTLDIVAGKGNNEKKSWPLIKDECSDLILIRWTSQSGAVRQHYFPIAAYIKGSDKVVNLISAGDGYLVDKNTFDAVRCRLTGLTQYGYWYYMDLLRASDAHAIIQLTFSQLDDEMASAQSAVYIEANEGETPEGVGFFNFEFTVKLRHYGTL